MALCVFAWIKAKRAPRTGIGKRTFEKRTYLAFAVFTTVISLAFAVGLVANVTAVLNPWPGFNSLVASLATPQPGAQTAKLFSATNTWIQSGSAHMPAAVHVAVQHRPSWQRPRAIVYTILMVALALVSVRIWKHLIARSTPPQRHIRERVLVLTGIGAVVATLLFTVLAVSNMRGTIAPLAITALQAGH